MTTVAFSCGAPNEDKMLIHDFLPSNHFASIPDEIRECMSCERSHNELLTLKVLVATIDAQWEFGVLCCLTTPGLRKDIRRQIRQLYSHKVTYYVHYNYILSSHLLSHSRFYFYY